MGGHPFVRRSTLILPVNRPQFVAKSWQRGADAILLDLEDSIPDSEKAEARKRVREAIQIAGQGGGDVLVRINNSSGWEDDLEASIHPGLHGIVIPKVESVSQVNEIETVIEALEKSRGLPVGSIKLGLLIETAQGFSRIFQIATASKRVETINLGTEDFTLDLQMELEDGTELMYPKMQTIIAASLAGIQPLGLLGSIANFRDVEGLYVQARKSYKFGFKGASCIHPAQVPVYNQAFSPAMEDLDYARKVIEAYEESQQRGVGATSLDGKMIDFPVVKRARAVIERQQAIELMEQRKRLALEKASPKD
ncbi:HpcH/HpaI aldolase/citrate lyase family protein [Brevibacillus marinus]|uniref:HpcH/HpaI aldolase/citrate lyase family protein n=1 Tax=Brevibacillus marinus TaxID=2496837 RepID=UPI000F81F778|nr:CoA ester lyase [Brevibacillus marinus]